MGSSESQAATTRKRRNSFRSEDGQVLVISVLAMLLLVAIASFVIDVGLLYMARHKAQIAADAGALAAVHALQTNTGAVTTAANTYANTNSPGNSSVGVTLPGGINGNEVDVSVTHPVSLLFGGLFGLRNGSVSASAAAQVGATQGTVPGGQISPTGCSNGAFGFCEYSAVSPIGSGNNSSWTVFAGSVDVQPCGGAVGASCTDPSGNPIQNEVIDLNGYNAGAINQTVTTIPGDQYVLSFDLSGNPAGANCSYVTFTGYLNIAPTNASGGVTTQSFSHTNACTGSGSNVSETATYQVVNVPFTATSSSTGLYFASTTLSGQNYGYAEYGPEITNIALQYGNSVLIR